MKVGFFHAKGSGVARLGLSRGREGAGVSVPVHAKGITGPGVSQQKCSLGVTWCIAKLIAVLQEGLAQNLCQTSCVSLLRTKGFEELKHWREFPCFLGLRC